MIDVFRSNATALVQKNFLYEFVSCSLFDATSCVSFDFPSPAIPSLGPSNARLARCERNGLSTDVSGAARAGIALLATGRIFLPPLVPLTRLRPRLVSRPYRLGRKKSMPLGGPFSAYVATRFSRGGGRALGNSARENCCFRGGRLVSER